jgi:hypothetical protein
MRHPAPVKDNFLKKNNQSIYSHFNNFETRPWVLGGYLSSITVAVLNIMVAEPCSRDWGWIYMRHPAHVTKR